MQWNPCFVFYYKFGKIWEFFSSVKSTKTSWGGGGGFTKLLYKKLKKKKKKTLNMMPQKQVAKFYTQKKPSYLLLVQEIYDSSCEHIGWPTIMVGHHIRIVGEPLTGLPIKI